jgi:class 3 adenylate cyclase
VLGTLRHERGYERVLLRGLQEEEVKRMIEAAAQHELQTSDEIALVDAVHRETEGNPFFIEEVIRHLIETGGVYRREGRWVSNARRIEELGIPEGVRDVIGRRLAHLSDDTGRLLTVASVIGREFRYETLEAVGELEGDVLLEALEEAVDAGILQEITGEVGRYGFTHAVIRETLYDDIATSRRLGLHRTIGAALEHFHAESIESHLPELAYHYLEAAHAGDVDKAVDYAARAGRRSVDLSAYEEAAGHYERALQVLDVRPGNGHQRYDLLMALGDAQWRAGDVHRSKATFREAARIAREQADPERFAAAALGIGAGLGGFGVTDRADTALLEVLGEALESLPDADNELRVRVLARLAVELYYTDAINERTRLSGEAVAMAGRIGHPRLELLALYSRHWSVLGPDDIDAQVAAATEIVRLAGLVGDREMAFRGHHFRLHSLLVMGDHAAVDAEIRSCERLAKELRQPLYLWQVTVFRAMRELQKGNLDEAERLAQEAWQIGQRSQQEITLVMFGAQIAVARIGQGRIGEIIEGGDGFVEQYPHSAWPAAMSFMYSELGRREDARALFERQAANGFAGLRRDGNWLAALTCLSMCAAYLGDAGRAAELYDLLEPYAERCPALQAGAAALPTNHAPLGILAATMGRWEAATRHFERALELTTTRDVGFWRPAIQREYARMLILLGDETSRERALSLLADAIDLARAQGMKTFVEQLLELKMQAQGVVAVDVRTSIDVVADSVDAARPDLRPATAPDGTVTMMFSDIEGSAAMTERLGDQRWLDLLRAHNAIVRRHVRAHGGFEVKSQGDGFMLAFASARRAVGCAIAIQRAFSAYSAEHPDDPLRVRIGLHTGEAIRDQDDFFGRTVVLAARIGAVARGGETLVSSLLRELTASSGEFVFDGGRDIELKGLAGTHRVYAVDGQENGSTAPSDEPAHSEQANQVRP